MKHFYVLTNQQKDPMLRVAHRISHYLEAHGAACTIRQKECGSEVFHTKYTDPAQIPSDVDCVLVLGGDGTLLRASRDLVERHLPLFGINLGTLGYLAEVDESNIEGALDQLIMDQYITEERMMIKGTAYHQQKKLLSDVALNDIVITRCGRIHVTDFQIYVNDNYLNSYSADGIIITTPTGSTGYNLSAGGPIVSPEASLIGITPVAPHTLTARSVILPDHAVVKVVVGRRNEMYEKAEATFDGDMSVSLDQNDYIEIEKAESTVKFVKLNQISFLETLRKKMSGV